MVKTVAVKTVGGKNGLGKNHGRRQDFLQEGANIEMPKAPSVEAPQAPRGERSGEGVSPSPAD